jgi:hypothetical protein
MSIAVSAFALSSCFDSTYSENYTLIASFEYGKQVTLRPDSTYFTTDGYAIGYNYLAFCHDTDPQTKEFRGGFRLSALEGQIKPIQSEEGDGTQTVAEQPALDMKWRAHSAPGANMYLVYYMSSNRPECDVEFLVPTRGTCVMKSCHVTNTAMVAEEISTKFERNDQLLLRAIGFKDGKETGTAEIPLAYTQYDQSSGEPKDSIVSTWTAFDLSKLQAVDKIKFELVNQSDKTIPMYFCVDNVVADITLEF